MKLLKLSEFRKFTGGNLVEQEKSKSKLSFDPVPKNQVQREYKIATLLSQKTLIPVLYLITSAPIDSRIFEEKKFFDGGFVLFLLCFLEAVLFWKQKSLITKGSIWKLSFANKEKIQIFTPLHLAA